MGMPSSWPCAHLRNSGCVVFIFCAFTLSQGALIGRDSSTKHAVASGEKRFRFEAISDKSLKLWEGDQPVLVYNHGVITSPSAPNAKGRSSYFHPVYGLDGEILTDDFPKDHENHRGLHWAWPHIKIDNQEVDLWSLRDIRDEFQRWLAKDANSKGAELVVENAWFFGDKRVMLETVRTRVHPSSS